jgi:hypothetical protein
MLVPNLGLRWAAPRRPVWLFLAGEGRPLRSRPGASPRLLGSAAIRARESSRSDSPARLPLGRRPTSKERRQLKVLVTGAGGNLARVVVPALAAAGDTLGLLDVRPTDTPMNCSRVTSATPTTWPARSRAPTPSCTPPPPMASIAATDTRRTPGRSTWTVPSTSTTPPPPRSPRSCSPAAWPSTAKVCSRQPTPGHRHRGQPDPAR